MVKALIRMGDMTTHGGKVIEGFSDYTIQNIPVAGVGHKTICPLCKGVFPIVQGYGGITVNGIFVALEGHVTACGAKLIPSQHEEVVDDGAGGDVMGKENKWISFKIPSDASYLGTKCKVLLDDGTSFTGLFDKNNLVKFENITGNKCIKFEMISDEVGNTKSLTENLLKAILG